MPRKLIIKEESFPLLKPFKIAHGVRSKSDVIVVEIYEGDFVGVGEATPYARYGETCKSSLVEIEKVRKKIESGIDNEILQKILPAGAARNAVDCALWDLEAKKQNKKIWQIADLPKPKAIYTAFTLVIDEPEIMAKEAEEKKEKFPIFKLKLAGDGKDMVRISEVRKAAPKNKIVLDANESWAKEIYQNAIAQCKDLKISMIEQPFKSSDDDILKNLAHPITICADESCHVTKDLENLREKYDMINIKLDKSGGLSEGIKMFKKARELNFQIMVGCMVATSRAILPAFYLAQLADFVDIDAPLLLANDLGLLKFDGARVEEK